MKRILLLVAFVIGLINTSKAKSVDISTAQKVAETYLNQNLNQIKPSLVLAFRYNMTINSSQNNSTTTEKPLFYIFNLGERSGFIIVAGDDNSVPILAYTTSGSFKENNLPPNLRKWLEGYKKELEYIITSDIQATNKIKNDWNSLINGAAIGSSRSGFVDPLLTTKWGQSPYYNANCPGGSVTGCVATAMAQVMKYWNHPQQGTGYHSYIENDYGTLSANFGATTYNWGIMPNILNSDNDAVATLMTHCGISVNMDYSPQVSGAWVIEDSPTPQACSEYAFKNYFGYSSNLQGVKRDNYTPSSWINLMKSELDAGRPILHAGFGSGGGHAFVCDGYDNNDYFHFNWGWGGNSDGYFWNDALNPGSLGTGGGSGGYNNGQQIIIGVQPSSDTQPTNIELYSHITVSPNPIQWGQGFTVNADIINNGTSTFYGDITAALFDDSGNFIDYIQTLTESNGLMPSYHYTGGLNFSTSGLGAAPGDYYIGIYVNPGNQWYAVGNGGYSNFIPVSIVYQNDIELYADIVPSSNPLIQNQAADFTLDLANYGFNDYFGTFSIDVHDLDGNWIETIDEFTGMSLCSNCHYTNGLTFSTSNLDLAPGSYLLAAWEKLNGGDWDLIGSTDFNNPIIITVAAPQLSPDIYENNDSQNNAYNLSLTFSGNSVTLKTAGSNSHVGDDYDYYKVSLPSGYNYTITPRVHDSYNSGNGQTYTNDVLFSYNESGVWSDSYDDEMNGGFIVSGGNTLYFHIAPYFQGQTGTYLLDIQINRTPITSTKDGIFPGNFKVFPNPASQYINVVNDNDIIIKSISIIDMNGRVVKSVNCFANHRDIKIPIQEFAQGMYMLILKSDNKVWQQKFIKS